MCPHSGWLAVPVDHRARRWGPESRLEQVETKIHAKMHTQSGTKSPHCLHASVCRSFARKKSCLFEPTYLAEYSYYQNSAWPATLCEMSLNLSHKSLSPGHSKLLNLLRNYWHTIVEGQLLSGEIHDSDCKSLAAFTNVNEGCIVSEERSILRSVPGARSILRLKIRAHLHWSVISRRRQEKQQS